MPASSGSPSEALRIESESLYFSRSSAVTELLAKVVGIVMTAILVRIIQLIAWPLKVM